MKPMENGSITYGKTNIPFSVNRSSRRRRTVGLAIEPESGVTVLAPADTDLLTIEGILQRRASWILRKLIRVREDAKQPRVFEFSDGATICYMGKNYRLKVEENPNSRRNSCKLKGGWLTAEVYSSSPEFIEKIIKRWFYRQAKANLTPRIAFWSEKLGVVPGKVMITNPSKRWASCDYQNNLRFNWRVMMVPSSLVDYVVAHELCHIVHKNHSPDFWRLLGNIMPNYDQRKILLKKCGKNLDL